jgi:hypothetical protein
LNWIKALCQHQLSEMRTGLKNRSDHTSGRVLLPSGNVQRQLKAHAMRIRSMFLTF